MAPPRSHCSCLSPHHEGTMQGQFLAGQGRAEQTVPDEMSPSWSVGKTLHMWPCPASPAVNTQPSLGTTPHPHPDPHPCLGTDCGTEQEGTEVRVAANQGAEMGVGGGNRGQGSEVGKGGKPPPGHEAGRGGGRSELMLLNNAVMNSIKAIICVAK